VAGQGGRAALRAVGWVCIAAGAALVLFSFAPLLGTLSLIGGHSSDPQGDLDGMIQAVKARFPVLALGFGLLIVGAVVDAAAKGEGGRRRSAASLEPVGSRRRCALCGSPVLPSGRRCSGGHEQ
jgi:hypothetical protein